MSEGSARPAVPRHAATTLVVREQADALEVLMLRRSLQASFMPGSYVFPGGAVDAADASADAHACCDETPEHAAARLSGTAPGGAAPGSTALGDAAPASAAPGDAAPGSAALGDAVAALRECFEECGLWLGVREVPDAARLADARARLHRGAATMAQSSRELALPLATSVLHAFSRWVTPIDMPRRFDTRFFVALAPPGQIPSVDAGETTTLAWVRPVDALAREADGEFPLEFATRQHLRMLASFRGTAELLAHLQSPREIVAVHPRIALDAGGQRRVLLPGDAGYAEVSRLDPRGSASASCAIVPGRIVRLGASLRRLTAPNPGMMTGPGTNSYLLGRDGGECIVIDPGPALDSHVGALLDATEGRIAAILITHTHIDHSPAAALLARASGAPCFGLPAPTHGRHDATFMPQRQPADGATIELAGIALRALRTPGHASNHVCWWYEDERMLFTGDHLMQGSTVVIDPPDGDMAAYLASLRALAQRLPQMQWLAPGHGMLVDRPHDAIERLIAHRLAREAKVLAALARLQPASLDELLPAVYDDVPRALHAVAARSLLAHVIKLRDEGRISSSDGGRWRPDS